MSELQNILDLWKRARATGEDVCLVTVVRVEGSSYRKPGARMLLSRGGERAGTVSGGCLESEVQKKAWWLTANGAIVQSYSSFFDDDAEIPYGLGCGGTVWLLMERGQNVDRVLTALEQGAHTNQVVALGIRLSRMDGQVGTCATSLDMNSNKNEPPPTKLSELMHSALQGQSHQWSADGAYFAEIAAPPQRLFIFGAGDDAQPIVEFAHALGWRVIVVDGRQHLATSQRFPLAEAVHVIRPDDEVALRSLSIGATDAVVLVTHSYVQDRAILPFLLSAEQRPRYIGVLGPRARTERLLGTLASPGQSREWMDILHAPVGLDIGSNSPAEIALSIVAEIQSVLRYKASKKKTIPPELRITA